MNKTENPNGFRNIFDNLSFDRNDIKQNKLLCELISITISLRDELIKSENYILTIEDTQKALDALSTHLKGQKLRSNLTKYQKLLADRLIDCTILFKLKNY